MGYRSHGGNNKCIPKIPINGKYQYLAASHFLNLFLGSYINTVGCVYFNCSLRKEILLSCKYSSDVFTTSFRTPIDIFSFKSMCKNEPGMWHSCFDVLDQQCLDLGNLTKHANECTAEASTIKAESRTSTKVPNQTS